MFSLSEVGYSVAGTTVILSDRNGSNKQHNSGVNIVLNSTSKTHQSKNESKLGCHYTALLELPYYRPIEMTLIDPTSWHCKTLWRDIWITKNIIGNDALADRIQITQCALGNWTTSCFYKYLTAGQWKNWTLYFYLLLKNCFVFQWAWKLVAFVLACRKQCKLAILSDDVKFTDILLLQFCKRSAELYGCAQIPYALPFSILC